MNEYRLFSIENRGLDRTTIHNYSRHVQRFLDVHFGTGRVELAVMEVQDSEYWSSGVLDEFSALHRRSCEIAQPDPVSLATRWFELRLKSPLGVHRGFPEQYRDVLGVTGLKTLERLVDEAMASVSLTPPDSTVGYCIPQNYTPSQSISEGSCPKNASQNSLDHSRPTVSIQTHRKRASGVSTRSYS